MQVSTTVLEFKTALATLSKIVAKRAIRPALECVRLCTDGADGILIQGTDLDSWLSVSLPATLNTSGVSVFRLADLIPFLRAADGGSLDIKSTTEISEIPKDWKEGDSLPVPVFSILFSTGSGEELKLDATDPDEFPVFPALVAVASIQPDEVALGAQLRRVLPAVAREAGRYSMHGLRIEIDENSDSGTLIATDGWRLHIGMLHGHAVELDSIGEKAGTMPRPAAKILAGLGAKKYKKGEERRATLLEVCLERLAPDEDTGEARGPNYGGQSYHRATVGSVMVVSRVIEGEFPRYGAVIPTSHDGVALLDSAESLKRVALVESACSGDAQAMRFTIADRGQPLSVSCKSKGKQSSAALGLAVLGATSDIARKGFAVNPGFFSDAVRAADSEHVSLQWTDKNSPIVIESAENDFRAVVMPITVDA